MKIIFTALLSFFSFISFAQEYKPVFENDKWYCSRSTQVTFERGWFEKAGDSLVNGVKYTKILNTIEDETYLVREVPEEKKTYAIHKNTNKETLLYDFSAEEGDTLWYYKDTDWETYFLVGNIDTIETLNGKARRFTIYDPTAYNRHRWWIEGIGDIKHPVFINGVLSRHMELFLTVKCVYNGTTLNYSDGIGDCPVVTANKTANSKKSSFNIKNNMLQFEDNNYRTVSIFSMNGIKVKEESGSNLSISLKSLEPGIYVFVTTDENNNFYSEKLSVGL